MVNIQEVEQKFFEAMVEGWATDAAKNGTAKYARMIKSSSYPSYKIIEWREGDWLVVDSYGGRADSPWSSGNTLIFFQDTPVWVMYYGGWLERAIIPLVKKALATAYRDHQFFGGRGPEFYREGNLIYTNRPNQNCFFDFSGEERILDLDTGKLRGYHEYRGFILLPH